MPLVIERALEPDVDAELDAQLRALLSLCFTKSQDQVFLTQRYFHEMPQRRWFIRGEEGLVAHVAVHEKVLGSTTGDLPVWGIAEVCVHPEYRGQGLVKKILERVHKDVASADFLMLFGKTNVYASSGYRQVDNPLRVYESVARAWKVQVISSAMIRSCGKRTWPEGEIDLRGPMF